MSNTRVQILMDEESNEVDLKVNVPPHRLIEMIGYLEHVKLELLAEIKRRQMTKPRIVVPKVGPN